MDKIQTVRAFLASSIRELRDERSELVAFFDRLNEDCKDSIRFDLFNCENRSDELIPGGKQEREYDAVIQSCHYFYAVIGTKAGQYTRHEFDVAWTRREKEPLPHIRVYFLKGRRRNGDAEQFKLFLREKLNQYPQEYANLESVKLSMILGFLKDGYLSGSMEFRDGQALVDGKPLMSARNLPAYKKNARLQQLIAENRNLGDAAGPAADHLHGMEAQVQELYSDVFRIREMGEAATDYERKAAAKMENGDYNGAIRFLRDERRKSGYEREIHDIEEELRRDAQDQMGQAERLKQEAAEKAAAYIRGNRFLIRTLQAKGVTKDTLPELNRLYTENVRIAEEYRVEMDVLYDYGEFLRVQNDFHKALDTALRLEAFYEQNSAEDWKRGRLFRLIGFCYSSNHQFRQSEQYLRASLEIYRKLAEDNPREDENVAKASRNLAGLLFDWNHMEEAEKLYRDALRISRRLAEDNDAHYAPLMAWSYKGLAGFLYEKGRLEEAETLYREALGIYRRFEKGKGFTDKAEMAGCSEGLASCLHYMGHMEEAESLFIQALKTVRNLTAVNPSAYEPFLAVCCNNYANLLDDTGRSEQAGKLYREAEEIRRRLAERNPDAWESDLAFIYLNQANFERERGNSARSWELGKKAFTFYVKKPVHFLSRMRQGVVQNRKRPVRRFLARMGLRVWEWLARNQEKEETEKKAKK